MNRTINMLELSKLKKLLLATLVLFLQGFLCKAQTNFNLNTKLEKGITISLITCGTGNEIYSVFGHTALRIIDSTAGTDIVYNYGTFDGYEEDFELKFMRGKLLYYLSEEHYQDFIDAYRHEGRWVKEQFLNIKDTEKKEIQAYMQKNMLPENRAYKYDFFFDNCATRIRDIFLHTFSGDFIYPNVLPTHQKITFRDIINHYLQNNGWERLGINIVLGSKIDAKMSNDQIMFLPDYLMDAVGQAKLNQKKFVAKTEDVVKQTLPKKQVYNGTVLIALFSLLAFFLLGSFIPQFNFLSTIITHLMLLLTGLLGGVILVMWFGTDHQTCANNYNLLWALPTNLFFVFRKRQYKYALIAMLLILVSFTVHFLGIQQILMPEMLLILILQLFVLGSTYRKYKFSNAKKST